MDEIFWPFLNVGDVPVPLIKQFVHVSAVCIIKSQQCLQWLWVYQWMVNLWEQWLVTSRLDTHIVTYFLQHAPVTMSCMHTVTSSVCLLCFQFNWIWDTSSHLLDISQTVMSHRAAVYTDTDWTNIPAAKSQHSVDIGRVFEHFHHMTLKYHLHLLDRCYSLLKHSTAVMSVNVACYRHTDVMFLLLSCDVLEPQIFLSQTADNELVSLQFYFTPFNTETHTFISPAGKHSSNCQSFAGHDLSC